MPTEQRRATGRLGCFLCRGSGAVPTESVSAITAVNLDGQLIEPCPFCLDSDARLYGTQFVKDGHRIDPTTVRGLA